MKLLRGTTDYNILSFSITEKRGELTKCDVITLSKYYYNFLNETGELKLIINGVVKFIGIIDTVDSNFKDAQLTLHMKEFVSLIQYEDLVGTAPDYSVSYSSKPASEILTVITADTSLSNGFCPNQTIASINGDKLNKLEWLELLRDNVECGLDSDGNYTTNIANIISDTRKVDIIADYYNKTISLGVKGCYRKDDTSDVWIPIKLNIDDFVIEFDELKYDMHPIKRVIVVGDPSTVYDQAYVTADTDTPVEVIIDISCSDTTACKKRAEDELNTIYKQKTIGVEIQPEKYFDKSIILGMQVIISISDIIAGTYEVTEISATDTNVSLTLGKPKERLLTSLSDIKKRVEKLEKW